MKNRVLIIPATGVLLGLLTACPPKNVDTAESASVPAPALHAVHSSKMAELMTELNKPSSRLPQEIEGEQADRFGEVAALAREMSKVANDIPGVLQEVDLNEKQRARFISLSSELRVRSELLADSARNRDLQGVREAIKQVNETCDACHTTFRILPKVQPMA